MKLRTFWENRQYFPFILHVKQMVRGRVIPVHLPETSPECSMDMSETLPRLLKRSGKKCYFRSTLLYNIPGGQRIACFVNFNEISKMCVFFSKFKKKTKKLFF